MLFNPEGGKVMNVDWYDLFPKGAEKLFANRVGVKQLCERCAEEFDSEWDMEKVNEGFKCEECGLISEEEKS